MSKRSLHRSDTAPEIEEIMIQKYRTMSPAEKVKRIHDLIAASRELALTDIRQRYPNISERQAKLRLAARYIPRHLIIETYGWDPGENE